MRRRSRHGRIALPDRPSLCFRCAEYHVMDPLCWQWAHRIALSRPDLAADELRLHMQAMTERRILDRYARTGVL